jgi:hypothetical protein
MDPFDWFSVVGRIFPRLVAITLVVGLIYFPRTADAVFMWAVHIRAEHVTSELHHALDPILAHMKHNADGKVHGHQR